MERFDAIVVGAGPAGSSTAIHLGRAGARVLLLDRARFPRDKPCGGGLTGRALRNAPCDVTPVLEHDVDRFVVRVGYRRRVERQADSIVIRMSRRRRLDHHLAKQASAAGADFRDGLKVIEVAQDDGGVTVRAAGLVAHAPFLVGADGANGIVARSVGLGEGILHNVALEGNVPWAALDQGDYARRAWVELGTVPGGYGWVCPKGDHVNVGVGGAAAEGPRIREHLDRLARAHGLDPGSLDGVRGHRIPMRRLGTPAANGRVLLVGDAAGLVDPLSGDGIYEAFVSGRLAAEAVLAATPEGYEPALSAALDRHAGASWKAKRVADAHPSVCLWAMRAPGVFDAVVGLLRGELGHPSDARRLARPPLRLLSRLAGSSPSD